MSSSPLEEEWSRVGLTLLSSDEDRNLVLFSSTGEMHDFKAKLDAYARGPQEGQKNPSYNGFVANVENIGAVEPRDRIGIRAREAGYAAPEDFRPDQIYVVDVELWDIGNRAVRQQKLNQLESFAEAADGEVLDRYIGPSISLVRIKCSGLVVRDLLNVDHVAEVDFLPESDATTSELLDIELPDLPQPSAVPDDAPVIGVIDTGLNDHPLIRDIIVGAIAVPPELGTADDKGHGTAVAGVAVFGDLRAQLAAGTLNRGARLCSAKVVDENGEFPDKHLIPRQMRDAITALNRDFNCRIFVVCLADIKRVFDGRRVGVWAATLDELAAELNILIVASAGNRRIIRPGGRLEEVVTEYPRYLMEPENRIFEPGGALNIVTVGSIAHGNGIPSALVGDVGVLPITEVEEPSPFTRVGPGLGNGTKPDFVDVGGTLFFERGVLRSGTSATPEPGVVSLHYEFANRLFTSASGTSFSAPLVALKAAQILAQYPGASANLVRALLATGAEVPEAAFRRLRPLGEDAIRSVCGNGLISEERASSSDDARVVLYVEDELESDHFAVYQIPIPEIYRNTAGKKSIKVTLAYDPPVRHNRQDYLGTTMSFRLIRGKDPEFIFDHFRSRTKAEGKFPELDDKFDISLKPGPRLREEATLQMASATFTRTIEQYGDTYYLVVRCSEGWAEAARQAFALVVEISHKAEIQLYERIQQRVRVRAASGL